MRKYTVAELIVDESSGNQVSGVAAAVFEDLRLYSDARALVEIGNEFWVYTHIGFKEITQQEADALPKWFRTLTYTAEGVYFE